MSVSKQDWKQWHTTYWADCQRACVAAQQSFDETIDALKSGDAQKFLDLTGGESDLGLHRTVNGAHHVVSPAYSALADLALKGNQRRFANQDAIDASDLAINRMSQLNQIISQVDTDLVRGVQIEHEAVQNDPSAINGLAGDLGDRLNRTLYMIKGGLESAEPAVAGLEGIAKIGRF